jgi:predicted enzyme related to lactoylglutathione lyase
MDVFDLGRMAVFTDPDGAGFAVWQPGTLQGLEVVNDPHSLCWTELYTHDPAASMAFYGAVLGMESSAVPWPDGTGTYILLNPAGGGDDSSFGGVVPLAAEPAEADEGPYWMPCFEVPDTDTTAARAARRHRPPGADRDGRRGPLRPAHRPLRRPFRRRHQHPGGTALTPAGCGTAP